MLFCMKKLIATLLMAFAVVGLFAKIGENRKLLENRLLMKSGGCILYDKPEERDREVAELPYKNMLLLMPKEITHQFYFKRPDLAAATSSDVLKQNDLDGWELHVVYYKDVSVMEYYTRYPVMYPEELARLMMAMISKRAQGTAWVATNNFIKKDDMSSEDDAKTYVSSDPALAQLMAVLPKPRSRIIEFVVPESVAKASGYSADLRTSIISDERQKSFARYKSEVEKDRKRAAEKTAKLNHKERAKQKALKNAAKNEQTLKAASSIDSVAVKSVEDLKGKELRIMGEIPNQENTAFGFNYISSDGALRAKLVLNKSNVPAGLLVIDARFDKMLRKYMEELYKTQAEERDAAAIDSVSKF